jgi:hypothetical protein
MADKQGVGTTQIVASSIGAIGAAYVGSRFGIAGTTLGAGVASVVAMGGSTLAQRSLERTHRTLTSRLRQSSADPADAPTERLRAEDLSRARTTPQRQPRRLTWKWAAIGAAGIFLGTLGVLTVLELGLGHPLSGGNEGTTLSGYLGHPTSHPQAPPARILTTSPTTTTAPLPTLAPSSVVPDTTTEISPPPTSTAPPTSLVSPSPTGLVPTTLLVPPPSQGAFG